MDDRRAYWMSGLLLLALSAVNGQATVRQSEGAAQSAPAVAVARQVGTVKTVSGSVMTMATDAGQQVQVTLPQGAKIVQLAPGSTDLKTAQPATAADITPGDRVLAVGKPGASPAELTAIRVVLMKSADIAQRNAAEEADWQKRGSGGVVTAVDASTGVLTVSAGGRKFPIKTTPTTKFKRYAPGSVKFQDATPSTLQQIHSGDQLRARGDRDQAGAIDADEVVSGSFKNLSGTLTAVDAANGTVTLRDAAAKAPVTVKVSSTSDLRKLPDDEAAKIAGRLKATADAAGGQRAAGSNAQGGGAAGGTKPDGARPAGGPSSGAVRAAGSGLAQLIPQLPTQSLADLKAGDAVMIVASEPEGGTATAVTLLTGVGPILKAMPNGSAEMSISPWNMNNGGGEAGGTPQ